MLLCFAHIAKVAGWTFELILRKTSGPRHVDVRPFYRKDRVFGPGDLAALLRLRPDLTSIAGHSVRPYANYRSVRPDAVHFTFVRDPVKRFISHYQWRVEHVHMKLPFEKWLRDPSTHNDMTKFISGTSDPRAAFQILRDRMCAVGVVERFDESLLLLRRAVEHEIPLDIHYGRPANTARRKALRQELQEAAERYRDDIREANRLDQQLYDRVVNELYPRQVAAYGPTLADDLSEFRRRNAETPPYSRWNMPLFSLLVYKPVMMASRLLLRQSLNVGSRAVPAVVTRALMPLALGVGGLSLQAADAVAALAA